MNTKMSKEELNKIESVRICVEDGSSKMPPTEEQNIVIKRASTLTTEVETDESKVGDDGAVVFYRISCPKVEDGGAVVFYHISCDDANVRVKCTGYPSCRVCVRTRQTAAKENGQSHNRHASSALQSVDHSDSVAMHRKVEEAFNRETPQLSRPRLLFNHERRPSNLSSVDSEFDQMHTIASRKTWLDRKFFTKRNSLFTIGSKRTKKTNTLPSFEVSSIILSSPP